VLSAEFSDLLLERDNRAFVAVVFINFGVLHGKSGVQGEIKPEKAEWITIPIFIELNCVILNIFGHALVRCGGCSIK